MTLFRSAFINVSGAPRCSVFAGEQMEPGSLDVCSSNRIICKEFRVLFDLQNPAGKPAGFFVHPIDVGFAESEAGVR